MISGKDTLLRVIYKEDRAYYGVHGWESNVIIFSDGVQYLHSHLLCRELSLDRNTIDSTNKNPNVPKRKLHFATIEGRCRDAENRANTPFSPINILDFFQHISEPIRLSSLANFEITS
jgi:hypothetical protein